MLMLCQRCGGSRDTWIIHQARLHVGKINEWKIQLCDRCTTDVEQAVLAALLQTNTPAPN